MRTPTDDEINEIKRMTHHAIERVAPRAHMILRSAQRRTVPEIASMFDVTDKTVRTWIHRAAAHGPGGLDDEARSGRPHTLTDRVRPTRIAMMAHDPAHAG
ncbi:helix-turn-helix domain-containing protein [Chloroflexus aurantiacus]|uniref:helix-turn-helix domain-containing protein n=1 Tax=Chloroflexus aurantiacus TaxID=1108 RepID=UPI0002D7BECB|nr:helix-turn-helix domain-containing protein [Chloroflexus aurantiacus]